MTNASNKPLSGKNALVTGGSRGIGAAIAKRLAADGANVAISYAASEDAAKAVVKDLESKGVKAIALKADQADAKAVDQMVHEASQKLGGLDILVNNAGVFIMAPIEGSRDGMARMRAINVEGVVAAVHAATSVLRDGGRIINIGSVAGDSISMPGGGDYAASKAAVAAYGRSWAHDFASRKITVNTVQPGPIATDMNPDEGDFATEMKKMIPLGRYGTTQEVAAAVAFLASPDAGFITGASLNVDGGASA